MRRGRKQNAGFDLAQLLHFLDELKAERFSSALVGMKVMRLVNDDHVPLGRIQ